ncbi:conserved hypothetical protein [Tenacibaculum sediminilitoris]|uniref:AAA family ATPase n=1 Tax=Tenacibaculum sediminilitoris TaxID=1820334 RepID=UPI0038946C18
MENTKNKIRVITKNFRAINNADIVIDGITVVAGENGCGKSTLSKLLYYLYRTISNYDSLVSRKLDSELNSVYRFLDITLIEISRRGKNRYSRTELYNDLSHLRERTRYYKVDQNLLNEWVEFIERVELAVTLSSIPNDAFYKRLDYIAEDIVIEESNSKSSNDKNPFSKIKGLINFHFQKAFGQLENRTTNLFKEGLRNAFHDTKLPQTFSVFELGSEIVSLNKNNLSIPYSIQNTVYIDTPMTIGIDTFDSNHWDDLENALREPYKKNKNEFFSNLISKEIINGDVVLDDSILGMNDFVFKRPDGKTFNLLDCATGIKSFSIIQLLLKNGTINNKTLLIIDEPESHLHPQWIIEYARLIVLLNKHIGVSFFIASHNPDMVSALKIIAEKEKTLEKLNFYLAEKENKKSNLYNYKDLGTDIEPIFESFNIALDRMDLYGSEDE